MNEVTPKNNTMKIAVIILSILLVGSLGFIAYDKLIKKEEPKTEENNKQDDNKQNENNKVEDNKQDLANEQLDINSEFVKNMVTYIPTTDGAISNDIQIFFSSLTNDNKQYDYKMYHANNYLYGTEYVIDDLIIFFIAMFTLNIKAISTKYTKYSHLIGGIIMLIIGLLMIFKPEWLMFNF